MRVGIYGGSFNPPHKMHEDIVNGLLNSNYLDRIIIVPTGIHYHYKNNLLANEIRYEMLKIVFQKNNKVLISKYEFKNRNVSTYETLCYFKRKYPNDQIYFICGMDNLEYLDTWEKGLEIIKNYSIIVIPREGYSTNDIINKYLKYNTNITVYNIMINQISSTKIRLWYKNNDNRLYSCLNNNLIEFIQYNHLYEEEL